MHIAATNPYPWPYDGRLDGAHLVLLVTGAQPAWADASLGTAAAQQVISTLTASVRRMGGSIVAVRHLRLARPGGGPCPSLPPLPDSDSAALLPAIAALEPDAVVDCAGADALYGSPLETVLRAGRRTHVLLTGFASEVTVDSTLRSLNDRGFECLVVTDALAPLDHGLSARILDSVTKSGGIFGALGTSAHVLAALDSCPAAP